MKMRKNKFSCNIIKYTNEFNPPSPYSNKNPGKMVEIYKE